MLISFQASPNGDQPLQNGQVYETPQKKCLQETAQKTLKKTILQKLEAGKYNSAHKKIKRPLIFKQTKQEQRVERVGQEQDGLNKEKELILRNQSQSHPGFYEYTHWLKLHAQSLAYVDKKFVEEFWKVLRLINYGEVFIPTGLVYDIFMDIKRNANPNGFEKTINNFLKENEVTDSLKSFKDLKSYTDIKQIQKAYKCLQSQEPQSMKKIVRSQSASNVFDRNFKEAKVRRQKKITNLCSHLIKQSQKLAQKPKVSIYKSECYQSLVKPERICKNSCAHQFKSEQQKYLEQNNGVLNNLFKAKQLDKSIFQGNIDNIPGVLSHLSRNQYCQAEKLKAQRESLKPQYSKKKLH